jgi:hypothetical protein
MSGAGDHGIDRGDGRDRGEFRRMTNIAVQGAAQRRSGARSGRGKRKTASEKRGVRIENGRRAGSNIPNCGFRLWWQ